jgi:hypothetical protein
MKYFLIAAILLFSGVSTSAQEDVNAKRAAYYRCAGQIEKDPHNAYEPCADYLEKYPNDDKRLTEYVGRFVKAYKKISEYVKSVPTSDFSEITTNWAVYNPHLLATISPDDTHDPHYQVLIKREYGSPEEERLLAKAESVYKNPQAVEPELLRQWRYIADDYSVLPEGEPKWWTGRSDGTLATELVTTGAVLYYYNLSQDFRNNAGRLKDGSFQFIGSTLKYEASIKKMDVYERAGRSFSDVYVANMTLTWGQVCGGLCGSGFTRNKIVVMGTSGEILEMFLDDPVNRSSWVS